MPCPYYVGNGCGCSSCCRFVKTTAVAVVGSNLQLTIPATTLKNHQRLCVCIAQAIPGTVTPNMGVVVLNGATSMTVVTRCSNLVYADQVKSRVVLHLTAATDTSRLVLTDVRCLCPTAHVFPVINSTTVTDTSVEDEPSVEAMSLKTAKKV